MGNLSQLCRSELCTPLRGGRQATHENVAKMRRLGHRKWVDSKKLTWKIHKGSGYVDWMAENECAWTFGSPCGCIFNRIPFCKAIFWKNTPIIYGGKKEKILQQSKILKKLLVKQNRCRRNSRKHSSYFHQMWSSSTTIITSSILNCTVNFMPLWFNLNMLENTLNYVKTKILHLMKHHFFSCLQHIE